MGLGKFLKKAARIALPIAGTVLAPGIGTALGSTLGTAALSGIGGALGGAAGGGIGGGGLSGALKGAALGGAGGYLAGGGLSDILGSSSSLSSGLGSGVTGDYLSGLSSVPDTTLNPAFASAAREGMSAAASTPTFGSAGTFTNAAGSAGAAGGGTLSGFFANPVGAIKDGISDVADPKNLLKGGLKYGLSTALASDNSGGYGALQDAASQGAAAYSPYTASGGKAATQLADLSGVNGQEAANAAMGNFQTSPGYDFARSQGIKALDASAARRGLLLSGNQQQAVQDYGTGLANQYYQQYLQNLQNQASQGMNAQAAQNQGNIDAATAYAAMKAGKANRYNQMLGGLSNFF